MTKEDLKITTFQDQKGYVFISYSSANEDTVFNDYVVPLQEKNALRVFCDKNFKNRAAQRWTRQMKDNIREADVCLLFVSEDYVTSYACLLEVLVAKYYKKKIIKIQINEPKVCNDYTSCAMSESTKDEFIRVGRQLANDEVKKAYNCYLEIEEDIQNGEISKYRVSSSFIPFLSTISVTKLNLNDGLDAVARSIQDCTKRDVFDSNSSKTEKETKRAASDDITRGIDTFTTTEINEKVTYHGFDFSSYEGLSGKAKQVLMVLFNLAQIEGPIDNYEKALSKCDNKVAEFLKITSGSVRDKRCRQLGKTAEEFAQLAKGALNGNDDLQNLLLQNFRSDIDRQATRDFFEWLDHS